jgi:hypothetical protein
LQNCDLRLSISVKQTLFLDRAMAQVVSSRPLKAESRVRARVFPCRICGGQSCTGIGIFPSSSVLPCQYHSTVAPYSYIIRGMNNRPVGVSSSETQSHPIDMNNNNNNVITFALNNFLPLARQVCALELMQDSRSIIFHVGYLLFS